MGFAWERQVLGYDGRVYETKWLKGGSAGDTFQKDKYKPAPSDWQIIHLWERGKNKQTKIPEFVGAKEGSFHSGKID